MKNKFEMSLMVIAAIAALIAGIITSNVIEYVTGSNSRKDLVDNHTLRKINRNNQYAIKITVPIINKNDGTADTAGCLTVNKVIQQVLENTIKTNDEIALMAVYSDDGTILAHFRPERIGKNMFDVDVELSDCIQEMFEAMKNRKLYEGQKYDPLFNDNIKFIVKPLKIDNLNHNLSLLIGVHESHLLR